jgi:Transglycosylase SLT domain
MKQARKNTRVVFFSIALLGLMLCWIPRAFGPELSSMLENPENPVLEEWLKFGQAKGFLPFPSDPFAFGGDSLSVGRLLRARTDRGLWTDAQVNDLSHYIFTQSAVHNVSPYLVLSLIDVESGFRPRAVSERGAMGLMQLLPDTAEFVAESSGLHWRGPVQLQDPKVNIDLGLRYYSQLKSQFHEPEQVLTAYNIGPGALEKKLKKGESYSLEYYHRVLAAMSSYRREARNPVPRWDKRKTKWL